MLRQRRHPRLLPWAAIEALLLATACHQTSRADDATPLPVDTPRVSAVEVSQDHVATIRAARYAELRARVSGAVESVNVDEGERVNAGDPVFAINTRALAQAVAVAEAVVHRATADLTAAQVERANTAMLHSEAVVSAAELALADAKVDAAEAALEEAEANAGLARVELDLATVEAPFAGTINRLPARVGTALAENDLFTTISDSSEVFAYFNLSERDALDWGGSTSAETRGPVELVLPTGALYPHRGAIEATAGELDPETRTLVVRARFPNPDGVLRHGGTGAVRLHATLPDALLVPQRATLDIQGNYFVMVVDGDGIARTRRIAVERRVGGDFVVSDGLTPEDRFIVEGVQKVRDGDRIATRPWSDGNAAAPAAAADASED